MSTRAPTYIVVGIAAFCTIPLSSASTITAASCSSSNIQTAINSASDGDIVAVPSCNTSWSGNVTIPNTKGITLQGAGDDATIINMGSRQLIIQTALGNSPLRITGFRFNHAINQSGTLSFLGRATNWRVDNNIFDAGNAGGVAYSIRVGDEESNTDSYTYGVIDNNQFINRNDDTSIFVEWGAGPDDGVAAGDYVWGLDPAYGTAEAVYIEDNVFADASGGGASQVVDGRWGAKYVVRHNTIHNPWISTHSGCTNGGRDPMWVEYYGNILTDDGNAYFRPFEIRSVSGIVFDNTWAATANSNGITVDFERAGFGDGVGGCAGPYGAIADGTNAWDENTPGESGWRALGQPGWGRPQLTDMSAATFSGLFVFRNFDNGNLVNLGFNFGGQTLLEFGRDIFNEAHMTIGPIASRPSTCGPGPTNRDVYISNDENSQDYTIYVCTETNTWTKHWEPYTYPHPLRQGSVAPKAPEDLSSS